MDGYAILSFKECQQRMNLKAELSVNWPTHFGVSCETSGDECNYKTGEVYAIKAEFSGSIYYRNYRVYRVDCGAVLFEMVA